MRAERHRPFSNTSRTPFQRQATAFLLAVVVHILLLLMLLRLATSPPQLPEIRSNPITFQLLPGERKQSQSRESPKLSPRARAASPVKTPPSPPVVTPLPLIPGLEHFNLAQVAPTSPSPGQAMARDGDADAGAGQGDGASDGTGKGPGGERLYNAEWQREPTNAELSYYLPKGVTGWGMIACQTVKNFRVENCQEIGQSPTGSGLARAVMEAAWQFRILPPRIGGRPMIGAWVRIRISYTTTSAKLANP